MPKIVFDAAALAENGQKLRLFGRDLGIEILPVPKMTAGFRPALETLLGLGFRRFGLASPNEDRDGLLPRAAKTLIQLSPPSAAESTVQTFGRCLTAAAPTIAGLGRASGLLGLDLEIIIMVNVGDGREGVELDEVARVLDLVISQPGLAFRGFGAIVACLGDKLPTLDLYDDLSRLVDLAAARGFPDPVVSLGGTVMMAFVAENGPGPITELRLGDPLFLGLDVYRRAELPGGPFRRDVFTLKGETLETCRRPKGDGKNFVRRALIDLGRFNVGPVNLSPTGYPPLDGLTCLMEGARIVGVTAGYLVLDVTASPKGPEVWEWVAFRPGYWALAQGFRNREVSVETVGSALDGLTLRPDFLSDPPGPHPQFRPKTGLLAGDSPLNPGPPN
jgi:predicted amino acid racemase